MPAEYVTINCCPECYNDGGWYCPPCGPPPPEPPVITGPNTVWWFNGSSPANYDTSITLTSSGGAGTIWGVVAGAEKVSLNATGSTATITSTGNSFSSAVGDIKITAQANSQTSDQFSLTSRTPNLLSLVSHDHACSMNGFGYSDLITYNIIDNLGASLPSAVPFNEAWTTPEIDEPATVNWGRGPETPATGIQLVDRITGAGENNPGINPRPVCVGNTPVQHWGQDWRIGSLVTGFGRRVQSDTLNRFSGQATHNPITSPAP